MAGVTSTVAALPSATSLRATLRRNIRDFALQIADAGFVRVVTNDVQQAFVGESDVFLGESGGFALLADQEALGDLHFLLLRVAREPQNFHAVLKRLRNGVQHVGGADEHDFREIVFDVEIMIGEGVVQLRVEDFHQRRRRIAAKIHGHLVDFVEDEHRVDRAGLASSSG